MLYYVELEDNCTVSYQIPEEEAIRRQKLAAATKNQTYESDQDALEDYMSIHWAKQFICGILNKGRPILPKEKQHETNW
jgi:hypothetical protein